MSMRQAAVAIDALYFNTCSLCCSCCTLDIYITLGFFGYWG